MSLPVQVGLGLAVFGAVTGLAELLGAANLGTAMGFGQIAFAAVVVALLVRRGPARAPRSEPGGGRGDGPRGAVR